ncbi:G-type lectin S-receptor-like serine/threonine-protein kinase [Zea mays]|uniref:G-type lectin S-receptor-like serine/threonine-protein kinase n=1 Tax=Zea mays TaxID=4577 RepID=A0A3L6DJ38_MAIZE|nr:G-type lectin S-receptor-like serine/threonine-protein kinase [Zea mays]
MVGKNSMKVARDLVMQEVVNDLNPSGQNLQNKEDLQSIRFDDDVEDGKSHELKVYSLDRIRAVTINFSDSNKLGEGGFGPVYMGTLPGGEVAVKRLCRNSGQGLEEFKNEVILNAKF